MGAGEPSLIAGIVRRSCAIPRPARVYIAGLSAGGSAAIIAATAYPDLFAAAGVHSGLPAGAAHNAASGFLAMRQGAPGDRPTVAMPTIVFHGDADTVVHPRNGRFVVARSLSAHPRLKKVERKGRAPGGRDYSVTAHRARTGKSCCEHWVVEGAGHAWAGGHPSGSYTDPAGPDASREMLRFFLRHRTSVKQRRPATSPKPLSSDTGGRKFRLCHAVAVPAGAMGHRIGQDCCSQRNRRRALEGGPDAFHHTIHTDGE